MDIKAILKKNSKPSKAAFILCIFCLLLSMLAFMAVLAKIFLIPFMFIFNGPFDILSYLFPKGEIAIQLIAVTVSLCLALFINGYKTALPILLLYASCYFVPQNDFSELGNAMLHLGTLAAIFLLAEQYERK
ncbi:MAG: hypothetical protein ABL880_05880 [Methylotenera sp.]